MRMQKILTLILVFLVCVSSAQGRRSLSAIPKATKGYIALTYDDGPNTEFSRQAMEKLNQFGAKATFYVNGNKINANTIPILRDMIASGHDVCNHSWNHATFDASHPDAPERITDAATARDNLQRTSQAIFDATGYWPFSFRAPFLEWGNVLTGLDRELNMAFVHRDFETNDWQPSTTAQSLAAHIMGGLNVVDGAIVLMHDTKQATVDAIPLFVPQMQAQGWVFVTVRELFMIKEATPIAFAGSNHWPRMNGRVPSAIGYGLEHYLWEDNRNDWWLNECWWTDKTPPWERNGLLDCGDVPPPHFTVSITGGTANPTSGVSGTTITLTEGTPPAGKIFRDWQVISGGVQITGNSFVIGSSNVVIEAVWVDDPTSIHNVKKSDNRQGIKFAINPVSDNAEISVILPSNAQAVETKIAIYDMTGNVVFRSGDILSPNSATIWDLRNSAGRIVANGTYLVVAEVKDRNGRTHVYSARLGVNR